jgi:hypothetical protein
MCIPYKLAYKPPLCGPCETNDLSRGGGAYSKVIYYGRWSVRHTNFAANLRQEGAYKPGGAYSEGGAYMLVYTVVARSIGSQSALTFCVCGQVTWRCQYYAEHFLLYYRRCLSAARL